MILGGREERRILLAEQSHNFFKQEVVMRKKERTKWLKQGNLNTKFFHSSVKWRRMRNEINGVEVKGQWCDDKRRLRLKSESSLKANLIGCLSLKLGWTIFVSTPFFMKILRCWLELFLMRKLRMQFGAVIV